MFNYFVDSEYKPLKAVLLSKPHPAIGNLDNLKEALHLAKIDYALIEEEFEQLVQLYKKLKIKTFFIDPFKVKSCDRQCLLNLMFTRDQFLMTSKGAIISGMSSDVRRKEVGYTEKVLRDAGVFIRKVIKGSGRFEGADALWADDKLLIIGVGNRTNTEGFRQIKAELKQDNIECISVPAPRGVLHLLGSLQFIDADTVLIRAKLVGQAIINLLKKNEMKIIMIPENSEIKNKQAMNFVTIAPRTIVMPASCPKTKEIYEQSGIKIAAEIPVSQFVCARGGIGCLTGILARA